MQKNIRLNKVLIPINNLDANQFLLESSGFDYIDIDPYGTPNPFLDSAVKRLSRGGVLAVTATDTAPLCGTYPNACKRKYWAVPKRDELMYETGLRILIRKIQLIGAQYDKALIPIYSYFRHHYFRVFLKCIKGKTQVDKILKEHVRFNDVGPIWQGTIWDKKLAEIIYNKCNIIEHKKFLKIIMDESKIQTIGYFDVHNIAKRKQINFMPKKAELIEKIISKGHKASQTHFKNTGIRSDLKEDEFVNLINLLRV